MRGVHSKELRENTLTKPRFFSHRLKIASGWALENVGWVSVGEVVWMSPIVWRVLVVARKSRDFCAHRMSDVFINSSRSSDMMRGSIFPFESLAVCNQSWRFGELWLSHVCGSWLGLRGDSCFLSRKIRGDSAICEWGLCKGNRSGTSKGRRWCKES